MNRSLLLAAFLFSPPSRASPMSCSEAISLSSRLGGSMDVSDLLDEACAGEAPQLTLRQTGTAPAADTRCIAQAIGVSALPAQAMLSVLRRPDPACPDLTATLRRPLDGSNLTVRHQTSGYGYRNHPILKRRKLHTGIDFRASQGEAIPAHAAGQVVRAGRRSGYGLAVELAHPSGHTTLYAHLSRIEVAEGDIVLRGQRLGLAGSTGMSTGPHLHFEVRQGGRPIDPSSFIRAPHRLEKGGRR